MQSTTDAAKRQVANAGDRYTAARKLVDRMARIYRSIDERRAKRMSDCGRMITAGTCEDCGTIGSVRVDRACGMRLCAICAMRRSRVIAAQSLEAVAWMREHVQQPYTMQLVTLTQRNVRIGDLGGELDAMLEAWAKLRMRRQVRTGLIGAARTIEVTYNHDQSTWHPHVHVLAMVADGSGLDRVDTWVDMWQGCMGLAYTPVADCRPLRDDGAVYEVSKYVTKFGTLLKGLEGAQAVPVIRELDAAVYKRRLHAWSGAWREARKALKQRDVEQMTDAELDEMAARCPVCGGRLVDALMTWTGMRYTSIAKDTRREVGA